MKKIAFILMTAILLVGGVVAAMPTLFYAQSYEYPPPLRTSMLHHGSGLIRRGSTTKGIGF